MTDEEKTIENLRKNKGVSFAEADIILNLIEKQQAEIEKKDKIIDKMAGYIACPEAICLSTEKEVIEYFTNKVEGGK